MEPVNTVLNGRFDIFEPIAKGGTGTVYRALDRVTGAEAAVKVLGEKSSRRVEDVIRYHSVLDAVKTIDHPSVVQILDHDVTLSPSGLRWVATEMVPGASLRDHIAAGSLSTDDALSIAIHICGALEAVHAGGIVHRDLKPSNVVVQKTEPPSVKLIDFGLSRMREPDAFMDPEFVSGTFRYQSPEQCGILRHPIDERSDLYSLGIILYEMLTGESPFSGGSLMEVLHRQAALVPEAPSGKNPRVPEILDRVVLRLLDKEPDRRYQTARGLRVDLVRIAAGDENFTPGEDDEDRLDFHAPLTGRDAELGALSEMAREARKRNGGMALIGGEAGAGKTRLAEELKRYALGAGMAFIDGSCGDEMGEEPFGPLREALDDYSRCWRGYSPIRQEVIRSYIAKTCGNLGRIISGFQESMGEILGECPEVVSLEEEREGRRFYATVSRFFIELAGAEGSLVLFVDDLHRADEGTMRLISELVPELKNAPLLVVGAFREGEVPEDHPLRDLIENKAVEKIKLDNLNEEGAAAFVERIIPIKGPDLKILSDYTMKRGRGNPLFSLEILKQAVEEKALLREDGRWRVDARRLAEMEAPEGVIGTLLRRIERIPENDRRVLSNAALIGKIFDVELLMALEEGGDEDSLEMIIAIIDGAVAERLVEELSDEPGKYAFTHDRVRESFLARVEKSGGKRELHGRVLEALEKRHSGNIDEAVYDLAGHAIAAGDDERIVKYGYLAGIRASTDYAHENSAKYFSIVYSLIKNSESGDSIDHPNPALECALYLGKAYLYMDNPESALQILTDVINGEMDEDEKAYAYLLLTQACYKQGDFSSCEKYARKGLELLGDRLPATKASIILSTLRELVRHFVYSVFSTGVKKKIKGSIVNQKKKIWFYHTLYWLYFFTDLWKIPGVVLRMYNIARRNIGYSIEYAFSMSFYSMLRSQLSGGKGLLSYFEKAMNLTRENNDPWSEAYILSLYAYTHYTMGEIVKAMPMVYRSRDLFQKFGDVHELLRLNHYISHGCHLLSRYDEAYQHYLESKKYVVTMFDDVIIHSWGYPAIQFIEAGDYCSAEEVLVKYLSVQRERGYWYLYCYTNMFLGRLYYEQGKYEAALERMDESRSLMKKNRFPRYYLAVMYIFHSDALASWYYTTSEKMSRGERKKILKTINRESNRGVSDSLLFYRGMAYRSRAQYLTLVKKYSQSEKYFLKAVEHDRKTERRYELARTLYEYGIFLKERGRSSEAFERLAESYGLFSEIGVAVFNERIARALGLEVEKPGEVGDYIREERKRYLLEKSGDFSRCGDMEELCGLILSRAMELTGGRNAYLFLSKDVGAPLRLESSRHLDESCGDEYSMSIALKVFESGEAAITDNAGLEEDFAEFRTVSRFGLKSVLCVPARHKDLVNGVLYLDNSLASGIFVPGDADNLGMMLSHAAVAIENMLLRERLRKAEAEKKRPARSKTDDGNLAAVLDYLEKNYAGEADRKAVSEDLGLSADYVGKLLKTLTGKTLREHLHEIRVNKAMDLLSDREMKITDAAMAVGFDSLRTFYRVFFRVTGMTPTEFRERIVKDGS